MKKIWISALNHNENNIKYVINALKPFHVEVDGHFWVDDLAKMAWANVKDNILNHDLGLWIIIADEVSLKNQSILKGLSGLSIMAHALRIHDLPILILTENYDLEYQNLPIPLKKAKIMGLDIAQLGVKIVAYLNLWQQSKPLDYMLNLHPLNELGLWIEIGLNGQVWDGLIFGSKGAEINFQACGKRGNLPEKCTLIYPQQGFKIMHEGDEYGAWSIKNVIDDNFSYFVRVNQLPEKILFTSYTEDNESDAYVIKLC